MKQRSMFKTIMLSIKDIFSIMPFITLLNLTFRLLTALISVIMVMITARLFDTAAVNGKGEMLLFLVVILIICYGLNIMLEKLTYRINNIESVPKFEAFHHRLSQFTVSLSLEAAETPKIGAMFWLAKDAVYQDRMGDLFRYVFEIIPSTFQIVGISVVLSRYSPLLVLLALLSILPSVIVRIIFGKKGYELHRSHTKESRLSGYLWGLLTSKDSIKELRCMGSVDYIKGKYYNVHRKVYDENKSYTLKSNFFIFLCDFSKVFFYSLSIGLSVYLVDISIITIGAFAACLNAFITMQDTSESLLSNVAEIKNACNYANNYYDFFDYKAETDTTSKKDVSLVNEIKVKGLSFKYPSADKNAIDGVDITIHKGEKIVVVGNNGSGKTTLSKLLMGLYKPTDGEITLDGATVKILGDKYYECFTLAAQNFGRYSISLRDNISLGRISQRLDDKRLIKACESVGIADDVATLGGLETELGVEFGGKELSGGQWQRIALARAIFRDADILILDEPTAALDPIIEYDVLTQFLEMARDKTAIIMSHRIGICRAVDRVLVMGDGKVIEDGNHEELLARGGAYTKMWGSSAKWYMNNNEENFSI